ncbi:hypothetical protein HanPI659440_Chr04g0169971 [Helianthus annuus]|nr:hypothetical protein HanPI659440_Chr04g0169971 [Helianthus annuus]
MREVEYQEKVAEKATKEAALSSLDTLVKMDKRNQALVQAKETKNMVANSVLHNNVFHGYFVSDLHTLLLSAACYKSECRKECFSHQNGVDSSSRGKYVRRWR